MNTSQLAALAAITFTLAACGSESPTPDTATRTAATEPHDAATTVTAATVIDAAPSATSASNAGTKVEPSDANVSKLLEGGPALTALPTRATDNGAAFDPALRSKLAPAKPAPP